MAEEEKQEKEEKKIIIDEDWKQQAQKEKDVLAAKEEAEKEKTPRQRPARGQMPRGDFAGLVSMLVTQALFSLGLLQVEGQDEREPDLSSRFNALIAHDLCLEALHFTANRVVADQNQRERIVAGGVRCDRLRNIRRLVGERDFCARDDGACGIGDETLHRLGGRLGVQIRKQQNREHGQRRTGSVDTCGTFLHVTLNPKFWRNVGKNTLPPISWSIQCSGFNVVKVT